MTLTTTIVLGIAIIIGFIIAGCILAAKKYPDRDSVLADLIAMQVRKEPPPARSDIDVPFVDDTLKNVFDIAWKLYEEKPDTSEFVELDADVGACQIIMDNDAGTRQIMLYYVFFSEEAPVEAATLTNVGGLYIAYHPYPEGKESVEEEICKILHITVNDTVKYYVYEADDDDEQ